MRNSVSWWKSFLNQWLVLILKEAISLKLPQDTSKHKHFRNIYVLLYGKVNLSVLISSFLVGILPYGPFPRKRSKPCIFCFVFKSRQIYLQLKLLRKHVKYDEEDDDELTDRKTNEKIQWQPTCIRAWTPLALCVHAFKLNKLNGEENETATISNFL